MSRTDGTSGLTLTGVTVQRQPHILTVILQGHGRIRYDVVPMNAQLFVLDIPAGVSTLSFKTLSIQHRLLHEIHIEQYSQKLRLVFDIRSRVRYAIKAGRNILAIQFRN